MLEVKNPPTNAEVLRDIGSIPGSGRVPGKGNGNALQYSCLRIPQTEEICRLQSMGLRRVGHYWSDSAWTEGKNCPYIWLRAFHIAQMVKNLPIMWETWVWCLDWEDPLEKPWQNTPVFLPGEFHRQRSLAGYSPQNCKESDANERLIHTHTHTHTHTIDILVNVENS